MKIRVETREDDKGRLDILKLLKDTRPFVTMNFEYSPDGGLGAVDFVGSRRNMPSIQEILAIVNSKFIDRISEVVKLTEISDLKIEVVTRPTVGTGKVIFVDDIEDLLKWSGTSTSKDATYAFNGGNSLKLALVAPDSFVSATRLISLRPTSKMGFEFMFSIDDYTKCDDMQFFFQHYDGAILLNPIIKYDPPNWYWYDENGNFLEVLHQPQNLDEKEGIHGAWHRAKLIVDFNLKEYIRFEVNQHQIDMTGKKIKQVGASADIRTVIAFKITAVAGQSCKAWFDDVIVTEE